MFIKTIENPQNVGYPHVIYTSIYVQVEATPHTANKLEHRVPGTRNLKQYLEITLYFHTHEGVQFEIIPGVF